MGYDNHLTYDFVSRLSMIVRVTLVLNGTVVVDTDWRFHKLCGVCVKSITGATVPKSCYLTLLFPSISDIDSEPESAEL